MSNIIFKKQLIKFLVNNSISLKLTKSTFVEQDNFFQSTGFFNV